MSLTVPSNPISINLSLSAADNFHALITQETIEPLDKSEYTLGAPTPWTGTPDFFNTEITITSNTERFSGSENLYYRRVDVGNKGVEAGLGFKNILRPIRLENNERALVDLCRVLGVKDTEFTLVPFTSGNTGLTHKLKAKPESLLYIGELAVKLVVKPVGDVLQAVPGFLMPYRPT